MSQVSIFRWRDGTGWLVIAGGGDFLANETLDIDAQVLGRTISFGPLALIWAAGDDEQADRYLEHLDDLGGRTGYLIDIVTEDDDAIDSQLSEAGIIVLCDGPNLQRLKNALSGAALTAMAKAYANGATIYAQGRTAAVLGSWANLKDEALQPGLSWIEDAIILPGYDADQAEKLKQWVQDEPDSYGIGLGKGAAIALSPEGAMEIWGESRVTVVLGKNLPSLPDSTS